MIPCEETATVLLTHRVRLVAYYTLVTGDSVWGGEVFREVCGRAGEREEGFDSEGHLLNWARMAGRNIGIEKVRAQRGEYLGLSQSCLEQLERQWMEGPEVTSAEGLEALSRCLSEQDPVVVELMRMFFFEGIAAEEIAGRKNLSVREVGERLNRAQSEVLECVHRRLSHA